MFRSMSGTFRCLLGSIQFPPSTPPSQQGVTTRRQQEEAAPLATVAPSSAPSESPQPQIQERSSVSVSVARQPLVNEPAMTAVLDTLKGGGRLTDTQRTVVTQTAHSLDQFLLRAADGNPGLALKLASNVDTPPAVLLRLAATSDDPAVLAALAGRGQHADVLTELAGRLAGTGSARALPEASAAAMPLKLANNVHTPPAALRELARTTSDATVLTALADKHRDSPLVVHLVMQNTATPPTIVTRLADFADRLQETRGLSLTHRNIITALAGKPVAEIIARMRDGDHGVLANASDLALERQIKASPEYRKAKPDKLLRSAERLPLEIARFKLQLTSKGLTEPQQAKLKAKLELAKLKLEVVQLREQLRAPELSDTERTLIEAKLKLDTAQVLSLETPLRLDRVKNTVGNVHVTAMLRAAPELANPTILGARIQGLRSEETTLQARSEDLQGRVADDRYTMNTHLATLTDAVPELVADRTAKREKIEQLEAQKVALRAPVPEGEIPEEEELIQQQEAEIDGQITALRDGEGLDELPMKSPAAIIEAAEGEIMDIDYQISQLQDDRQAILDSNFATRNDEIPEEIGTQGLDDQIAALQAKRDTLSTAVAGATDARESLTTTRLEINRNDTRLGEIETQLRQYDRMLDTPHEMEREAGRVEAKIDELSYKKVAIEYDILTLEDTLSTQETELASMGDSDPGRGALTDAIAATRTELADKGTEVAGVDTQLKKLEGKLHRLEHGQMIWKSVKDTNLQGGTDRRQFAQEALNDFRLEFLTATYDEVKAALRGEQVGALRAQLATLESTPPRDEGAITAKQQEITAKEAAFDAITIRACGSTDLTSDYDATVLSDISGIDTAIVKEINRRIGSKFGAEAGSVFDNNWYVKGGGPEVMREVRETGPKVWADRGAEIAHDRGQDVASLVKQRKYSTPEKWDAFIVKLETGLDKKFKLMHPDMDQAGITALVHAQTDRYRDAGTIYKQVETAIGDKTTELRAAETLRMQADPTLNRMSDFDMEATVYNRLYEHSSEQADVIKREWNLAPSGTPTEQAAKDRIWARYTQTDSFAQMFANEPYYSEGPIRHVVGNEQNLKGLKMNTETGRWELRPDSRREPGRGGELIRQELVIKPIQAMQSLNENLGDSAKEFEHLKNDPMGAIAVKASKYMGRLTRAIQIAIPADMPPGIASRIVALQTAEVELLRIRKGGEMPSSFTGTVDEYAMHVMREAGLGDLDTLPKLEAYFEDLKLDAEIEIRSRL